VVCLEVESAAWGLVARWGCGAAAAHEVAAAAARGVAASILVYLHSNFVTLKWKNLLVVFLLFLTRKKILFVFTRRRLR